MNHLVFSAFVDEMEKQAGVFQLLRQGAKLQPLSGKATRVQQAIHSIGAAPTRILHEARRTVTNPVRTFREGWQDLSNMSKTRKADGVWRQENLRGAMDEMGDKIKAGPKNFFTGAKREGKFVADFHTDPSVRGKLRRDGWLSNTPLYQGSDKREIVKNRIARALPGQKGFQVPLFTGLGVGELNTKTDPKTGRKRGLAERIGRAGGMATIGGLGMSPRFPILPMLAISAVAPSVTGAGGRAVDSTVSAARRKRPLQAQVPRIANQVLAPLPGDVAQGAYQKSPAGQAEKIQDTFRSFSKQAGFTVADFAEE
jgi:hypothetical protein